MTSALRQIFPLVALVPLAPSVLASVATPSRHIIANGRRITQITSNEFPLNLITSLKIIEENLKSSPFVAKAHPVATPSVAKVTQFGVFRFKVIDSASKDQQDGCGDTELMRAIQASRFMPTFKTVKKLLSEGVNPNIANYAGKTALSLAFELEDDNLIQLLLENLTTEMSLPHGRNLLDDIRDPQLLQTVYLRKMSECLYAGDGKGFERECKIFDRFIQKHPHTNPPSDSVYHINTFRAFFNWRASLHDGVYIDPNKNPDVLEVKFLKNLYKSLDKGDIEKFDSTCREYYQFQKQNPAYAGEPKAPYDRLTLRSYYAWRMREEASI